jgi:hypothetical protein
LHSLALLDPVTRSFHPARQPKNMSKSAEKSLLLYQIEQCAALAPPAFEPIAARLSMHARALENRQNDHRHPIHGSLGDDGAKTQVMGASRADYEAMRSCSIQARDAVLKQVTPLAFGEAMRSDWVGAPSMESFPAIQRAAKQAYQMGLLAQLREGLRDAGAQAKWPSFRDQTRAAIRHYTEAGGDLATRDPALYARLQGQFAQPSYVRTAAARDALDGQRIDHFHELFPDTIIRAYKNDRREIRAGEGDAHKPLHQRCATLDLVYALRWGAMCDKLSDRLYTLQATMVNPDYRGHRYDASVAAIVQACSDGPKPSLGAQR